MVSHPLLLLMTAVILIAPIAQSDGCIKAWGPVVPTEAKAAAEHIPALRVDVQATASEGHGRIVVEVPMAAHNIREPVVFYSGGTYIELSEVFNRSLQVPPGTFSDSELAFFLWPRAKIAALDIIAHCVEPTDGVYGGWASFGVQPKGGPMRRFLMYVKGMKRLAMVLRNRKNKGFDIWPRPPMLFD